MLQKVDLCWTGSSFFQPKVDPVQLWLTKYGPGPVLDDQNLTQSSLADKIQITEIYIIKRQRKVIASAAEPSINIVLQSNVARK